MSRTSITDYSYNFLFERLNSVFSFSEIEEHNNHGIHTFQKDIHVAESNSSSRNPNKNSN